MTHNDDTRGVIAKITGTIGALLSVLAFDPFGFGSAVIAVVWSQAGTLFTVTSIAGFTLAPEVPQLPAGAIQGAALLFGGLFILTLLDRFLDALEERLREED